MRVGIVREGDDFPPPCSHRASAPGFRRPASRSPSHQRFELAPLLRPANSPSVNPSSGSKLLAISSPINTRRRSRPRSRFSLKGVLTVRLAPSPWDLRRHPRAIILTTVLHVKLKDGPRLPRIDVKAERYHFLARVADDIRQLPSEAREVHRVETNRPVQMALPGARGTTIAAHRRCNYNVLF